MQNFKGMNPFKNLSPHPFKLLIDFVPVEVLLDESGLSAISIPSSI